MYAQTVITAAAVLILGLVLMIFVPGILGLWNIATIAIVTASALVFFGLATENILGILIAVLFLEVFAGLPLGVYLLSVAIAASVLMLAGNLIRIEPLSSSSQIEPSQIANETLVAFILAAIITLVSSVVMSLAYGYHWSLSIVVRELATPRVLGVTVLGILFSWACWRGVQHLASFRRNTW